MLGSYFSVFGKDLVILKPENQGRCYDIAAAEFQKYYAKVTGTTLNITTKFNNEDDYIVLGSDAVNYFVRKLIEDKVIPEFPLKIDSDNYRILSISEHGRHHLLLAGGRGRSTLYAVYDFFERQAGCIWFWDGEIVPSKAAIDRSGLDIQESPRFEYRGIRYFAHRGLHRFQAEHWSMDDWKKEIDWLLKKRLNIFMLRIGQDDMFQKAFPDIVPYPDPSKPQPLAGHGYDNRSLFWSLEYRGKLRKNIMDYAFDRDLMHPEDFGTMTHWYSPTPKEFLEKVKPEFVPQFSGYGLKTQLVWDIRKDQNLEYYWKLTQASVDNYGKPDLFHTIGLAERMCYKDRIDNQKMKVYVYRRLITELRKHYPNAVLLLAGWDFYGWWTKEEIQEFLSQVDKEKTLIWDYSGDLVSDGMTTFGNDVTKWGVVGKFPYTFGIFLAYESALDIRGRYDIIEKQHKVIKEDPYCKGYILWPESSHTDIFMLHYFTSNAWKLGEKTQAELLAEFCSQRYGRQKEVMNVLWSDVIPISQLLTAAWNFWAIFTQSGASWDLRKAFDDSWNHQKPILAKAPEIFEGLAKISWTDDFIKRDSIDLARTTLDRLATGARNRLLVSLHDWKEGKVNAEQVKIQKDAFIGIIELFRDVLALHDDYSLYRTLVRMNEVEPIANPDFDKVLLENASCGYCMSHQYELVNSWYLPTFRIMADWIQATLDKNQKTDFNDGKKLVVAKRGEIYQKMMKTPLKDQAPKGTPSEGEFKNCMTRGAKLAKTILQ